jgi:16S rRNA (cytidine1402-2'-O)-methyltransferase
LLDCLEILGDRRAAVARELTKLHEQFHRGTLSTLAREFDAHARGEIVLLIERGDERTPTSTAPSIADRVNELEAEGSDPKSALKQAAREYGVSKSEAYRRIQSEKK